MGVVVAPWETYGVTVDVALQADDARARLQTWCDAVAQAIDRYSSPRWLPRPEPESPTSPRP